MAPSPEIHKSITSHHADLVQRYVAEPSYASQKTYPPPGLIPSWVWISIFCCILFGFILMALVIFCGVKPADQKEDDIGDREAQASKESKPVRRHAEQTEGVTETVFQ